MQELVIFHMTEINSDTNGNPQYKFNVYSQPLDNGRTLRVINPKFGRFSKRHDAYVIKYWGNHEQTRAIIKEMVEGAGYTIGIIA